MILIMSFTQGPPVTSSVPTAKKHSETPPLTASVSTSKCAWTSKVTGAGAVADVADALRDMAAQFNADSSGTSAQATPQQRTAAIHAAATDLNLTRDQQLQVLHLFCDNIAATDAYLAIEDAEPHTNFILGAL
jgi:hypothetical protein